MLIAIDGYEANQTERVGIGRYAYEIIRGIYEIQIKKHDNETNFIVYLPDNPLIDMPAETSWWHYRIVKPKRLWTYLGLPTALTLSRPRPDLIFSPTHYAPRFISIPKVISIMDLSYVKYPQLFRSKDLYQLQNWTADSVRRAARIFTISQASKNDIISYYKADAGRIVVTYPGLNMPKNAETKPIKLAKNYILTVGTLQPRKNFVKLIEAFSKVYGELVTDFPGLELLIVGKRGWLYEDILAAPAKFGVEKQVKFMDFVPDEALPGLYKGALCFALPSLYEGFGLPVLEAMHYGTQVVVSNTSSLPEIAGSAGIYVDPEETQSIAKGLKQALVEKNEAAGRNRIKLGLSQAQKFNWKDAAQKTLETLKELA